MKNLFFLCALIFVAACSNEQSGKYAGGANAPGREVVASGDDINVDVVAVQYGPNWSYVGDLAFNIGTGKPRLPDPKTEVFILIVREELTDAPGGKPAHGLEKGYAYQWLGDTDFKRIVAVDLNQPDEELAKLFGVGRPSDVDGLMDYLDSPDIDEAEAIKLLKDVKDVNKRDVAGRSLIHQAAYWGHLEVIKALVDQRANVNLPGMNDGGPLAMAASGGNADVVEFLLSKGAKIGKTNAYGESALHSAMYNDGCVPCAKLLVDNGADVNLKNKEGHTPLSLAISRNERSMKNKDEMLAYLASIGAK